MSKLFSSYRLGEMELPNRIVMSPMTRCRASADHVPTKIMVDYYKSRSEGGLLITEGTGPSPNGCGYARIPGLWTQDQIDGWRKVTDAVHSAGGHIAAQIMHTGRVSHSNNMPEGSRVVAPSAIALSGEMYTDQQGPQPYPTPEAMSEEDIEQAIEEFVQASQNAMTAGFDAVELHGANGYLIDQFLNPASNQRQDNWGGDFKKGARFALEVAKRCAKAIGANRVGIRLSPFGAFNDMKTWDTVTQDYSWLAGELGKLKLAYIHIVDHSSMGTPAVDDDVKAGIRKQFGGTIILSGGYDKKRAEEDLEATRGELVAFGRSYLANPDLVKRLQLDANLNAPDFDTFYTPDEKGYSDYPTL